VLIGDISDCLGRRTTLSPGPGSKGFCNLKVRMLFGLRVDEQIPGESAWSRPGIYYKLSRLFQRRRYHLLGARRPAYKAVWAGMPEKISPVSLNGAVSVGSGRSLFSEANGYTRPAL
jgi:hypothetical protein